MTAAVGQEHGRRSGRWRADSQPLGARARRFVRFGLVGVSGVVVNEAALALFVDVLDLNYLLGAVLSTQCSTVWNFALVEWWAFDGVGRRRGRARRFLMFWAVNMAALALRGPILAASTSLLHIHYLVSNLISLGVLVVLRFAIADSLIWGSRPEPTHRVGPDDLLAHFPRDIAEDLGWALNPVAEAAEIVAPPESVAPPEPIAPFEPVAAAAIAPAEASTTPWTDPADLVGTAPDELPPPEELPRPYLLLRPEEPSSPQGRAHRTTTIEVRRYGSVQPPPLFP